MGATATSAPSPRGDGATWRTLCAEALHRAEPRLSRADCDHLSHSLWQLKPDSAMDPDEAAARFMAENRDLLLAASPI